MVMVLQSQLLSVSHVWKYKNNQKHMGYWYWLTVNPNIKRVKRCRKIARRIDTEPAAFFSVLSHAKTRRISDLVMLLEEEDWWWLGDNDQPMSKVVVLPNKPWTSRSETSGCSTLQRETSRMWWCPTDKHQYCQMIFGLVGKVELAEVGAKSDMHELDWISL